MPKRKVLFVVPALQRAGAENQLVTLVNQLPAEQFEKYLLSYRPGDDLWDEVDTSEIGLYELCRKGRLDFDLGKQIGKIIDERKIDVVHCTLQNALLFGYMGIRYATRKPKLIASIHTTKNASIKLDVADWLVYRPLLKKCDQVWFVSTNQADLWVRKMPFIARKCVTVHNGVDLDYFDPGLFPEARAKFREQLGISRGEKLICCIAGLRPEKMHSVLIEALGMCLADGIRCRLLLAGVGPLQQDLRKQVKTLQLDQHVHFLGSLADVRELLAAADCKVLVSAAETFSMAMLEAMAMRVPVITTSVGGASEAIDDGISGLMLAPGNPRELAQKITYLLSGDTRRVEMGEKARQVVAQQFSVEQMVAKSAEQLAT